MIRWFCDICKKEIGTEWKDDISHAHQPNENPFHIAVTLTGQNRDELGYGDTTMVLKCCHEKCAITLFATIKKIFEVKNGET